MQRTLRVHSVFLSLHATPWNLQQLSMCFLQLPHFKADNGCLDMSDWHFDMPNQHF